MNYKVNTQKELFVATTLKKNQACLLCVVEAKMKSYRYCNGSIKH